MPTPDPDFAHYVKTTTDRTPRVPTTVDILPTFRGWKWILESGETHELIAPFGTVHRV